MVSKEFDRVPLQTARINVAPQAPNPVLINTSGSENRATVTHVLLKARSILGGKHFPPLPLWHGAPTSMACSKFDPLPWRPLRP